MKPLLLSAALSLSTVFSAIAYADGCDKNHYILGGNCEAVAVNQPVGKVGSVATDWQGNVYFSAPHVVFRLDASGRLTRVAGGLAPGDSGDGGPAVVADLNIPYDDYPEIRRDSIDFYALVGGLATDEEGNLYIADAYNNRVRKIDTHGQIRTVLDSDILAWPQGVAVGTDGALYVSSQWGTLVKMTKEGVVSRLASPNCGPSFAEPGLCVPEQIAVDANGNVFVPDGYCRVRKVDPAGSVTTVAGRERPDGRGFAVTCGYGDDGNDALGTALGLIPYAVAVDAHGTLYIADTGNDCVRKVDPAGIITRFAGVCESDYARLNKPAIPRFGGDGGPALDARLNTPSGIAVDLAGNVFIADTGNQRVRKVSPDGRISTVAGNGESAGEKWLRRR